MNTQATPARKGRKFDQVLAGARSVFMADGFEGASVDEIARVAGVSKATLYSYFRDKRHLFMEVATTECRRQAREGLDSLDLSAPPRVVLEQAARHFLGFITSKFGQQIFRISIAESDRFPELGRQFYASGPALVRAEMAAYFEVAIARGELVIEDLPLAADQFAELCKVDVWPRLTFGMTDTATEAEVDRVVGGAIEMFMARYGV